MRSARRSSPNGTTPSSARAFRIRSSRHEWVRTWWDAFSTPASRLHIQVCARDGRLTAIAPLMREQAPMYGLPGAARALHPQRPHAADRRHHRRATRRTCTRAIWRALRTRPRALGRAPARSSSRTRLAERSRSSANYAAAERAAHRHVAEQRFAVSDASPAPGTPISIRCRRSSDRTFATGCRA